MQHFSCFKRLFSTLPRFAKNIKTAKPVNNNKQKPDEERKKSLRNKINSLFDDAKTLLRGDNLPGFPVSNEKVDFASKHIPLKNKNMPNLDDFGKKFSVKPKKTAEDDEAINKIFQKENKKIPVSNDQNDEYFGNKIPFINEKSDFSDFLTQNQLLKNLLNLGFGKPTHIQQRSALKILNPEIRTIVIGAETGSGKSIAFLAPIIEALLKRKKPDSSFPRAIITTSSDLLCAQLKNVAQSLTKNLPLTATHFVSSDDFPLARNPKLSALAHSLKTPKIDINETTKPVISPKNDTNFPNILFVTIDLLSRHITDDLLLELEFLVFDEADVLLVSNRGHWQRTKALLHTFLSLKKFTAICDTEAVGTQNIHLLNRKAPPDLASAKFVFSGATLGSNMVRSFLQRNDLTKKQANRLSPLHKLFGGAVWVESPYLHNLLPQVETDWVLVNDERGHKYSLLSALGTIKEDGERTVPKKRFEEKIKEAAERGEIPDGRTLIFCSFVVNVIRVNMLLKELGLKSVAVHEKMTSVVREGNLKNFVNHRFDILVCTDLLSRGIDFTDVDHVIQYDFARNVSEYIHRAGRTARAGHRGRVTNLYVKRNEPLVRVIRYGSGNLSNDFTWKRNKKSAGDNDKNAYTAKPTGMNKEKFKERKKVAWWRHIKV